MVIRSVIGGMVQRDLNRNENKRKNGHMNMKINRILAEAEGGRTYKNRGRYKSMNRRKLRRNRR